MAGSPGPSFNTSPLRVTIARGTPHSSASRAWAEEMARLAMHRKRHARLHQRIHARELVLRRMARHMDEVILLGQDLDAEIGSLLCSRADRLLVAGDHPRREDHHVALAQGDVGMVVGGDAGQGGARLALAAGADEQHLVAGR